MNLKPFSLGQNKTIKEGSNQKPVKGYKILETGWVCDGIKFTLGKFYEFDRKSNPSSKGFHFYKNLSDCYYANNFDELNSTVAEIIAYGETTEDGINYYTDKLELDNVLTWNDLNYKLSLCGKPASLKSKESKNDQSNNQPLNYIKADDKSNSPILVLESYDVTIQLCNDQCVSLKQKIKGNLDYGMPDRIFEFCSKIPFTYFVKNFRSLPEKEKSNLEEYNDILVLGTLCELLCKAGVPLNAITKNKQLVEEFVNEYFKGYTCINYEFNFDRIFLSFLSTFPVNLECALKEFLLLGKAEDGSLLCQAYLEVCRRYISVQYGKGVSDSIAAPSSLAYTTLEPTERNYLYNALIWTLLEKNGFYMYVDTFRRYDKAPYFERSLSFLYDAMIYNPDNCIEIP